MMLYTIRFYFVRKCSTSWFSSREKWSNSKFCVNILYAHVDRERGVLNFAKNGWSNWRFSVNIVYVCIDREARARGVMHWHFLQKNDLIDISVWIYSMRALTGRHSPEVSCPDFFGLVDSQVRHICPKETCIYDKWPATESYSCDATESYPAKETYIYDKRTVKRTCTCDDRRVKETNTCEKRHL